MPPANEAAESGRDLRQSTRLWLLVIYILGLLGVSKLALGSWIPPATEKGLWFYSALATLLLGNLLVSPFYTKPVDALSYAVASLIALLAIRAGPLTQTDPVARAGWPVVAGYGSLVLLTSIGSIALRGTVGELAQRVGRTLYVVSNAMGSPRAIFSVVFLFSLVAYHRGLPREYIYIGLSWALFVGLRPLEAILGAMRHLSSIWSTRMAEVTLLGDVVGHQVPNIVLVREEDDRHTSFGDLIVARSDDGRPSYAIALDHVGYSDGRWLRALLTRLGKTPDRVDTAGGSAYVASASEDVRPVTRYAERVRASLLGLVATDTTVGDLNVEIVRPDVGLCQGSLVATTVADREVLYQIIDGITREEIVHQKDTRGFVRARGRKIGSWNPENASFDTVPWLPNLNTPVMLVRSDDSPIERDAVGHFPGTRYPIRIEPHALVTHNTAVLGILGIGKSFLTLELVERMIAAGIRVVCLDLTNQYATELAPYYDAGAEQPAIEQLAEVGRGGKTKFSKNVEEGGSHRQFAALIRKQLQAFLAPESNRSVLIYNPARFEVWRQDSKPFQDQASMASLTPCEITRIIAEAAIEVLRDQGMTDKARCCLVLEEAHSLIPEWNAVASEGDKAATNGTAKAILQGRKFGLGCVVVTQRTANVTKTILNQCGTVFALRVYDATGVEFLSNYIGGDYAGVLSSLDERHAVVYGRGSSCKQHPVLVQLNDRGEFLAIFREAAPAEPAAGADA